MSNRDKVLVVDDSQIVRRSVIEQLQSCGEVQCIEAEDGTDGLEKLLKHRGEIRLIICDVNMPNMDGLTMAQRHYENVKHGYPECPFIMLTTESSKEMVLKAKKAGVSGWILKPLKPESVASIYNKFLNTGGQT